MLSVVVVVSFVAAVVCYCLLVFAVCCRLFDVVCCVVLLCVCCLWCSLFVVVADCCS